MFTWYTFCGAVGTATTVWLVDVVLLRSPIFPPVLQQQQQQRGQPSTPPPSRRFTPDHDAPIDDARHDDATMDDNVNGPTTAAAATVGRRRRKARGCDDDTYFFSYAMGHNVSLAVFGGLGCLAASSVGGLIPTGYMVSALVVVFVPLGFVVAPLPSYLHHNESPPSPSPSLPRSLLQRRGLPSMSSLSSLLTLLPQSRTRQQQRRRRRQRQRQRQQPQQPQQRQQPSWFCESYRAVQYLPSPSTTTTTGDLFIHGIRSQYRSSQIEHTR